MTPLGLTILVGAGVISFALAFVIVLVPMNLFVRAYLIGFGWTGLFVLPFVAPGHEIDIQGAYWFGVALWAVGAWLIGLTTGVLMRFLWSRRRERQHRSTPQPGRT
jgi:hypothetical protein